MSKTKLLARKNFEALYNCKCDIIEYQEVQNANKSTSFTEITVLQNQPCRVSYKTGKQLSAVVIADGNAAQAPLTVKLFISPEIQVKTGSKIAVTDSSGRITNYKFSGQSAIYDTHQEIMLEIFERWS